MLEERKRGFPWGEYNFPGGEQGQPALLRNRPMSYVLNEEDAGSARSLSKRQRMECTWCVGKPTGILGKCGTKRQEGVSISKVRV